MLCLYEGALYDDCSVSQRQGQGGRAVCSGAG